MLKKAELQTIIESESIRTLFHPIVSIKEKRIVGFEALSRGINNGSGSIISPIDMFKCAQLNDLNLELDRLCRKIAIKQYQAKGMQDNFLLFVNFDPGILNKVRIGCGWMNKLIESYGIKPFNIAIEIVESKVETHNRLSAFVDLYREYGFHIVLDDFGADHSNLNRILLVKPDIIKIDRELTLNISRDYYKQAIVGSIVELGNKIGSVCLAEGVETLDDIIMCHELGLDYFQGFFFSLPLVDPEDMYQPCTESMKEVTEKLFAHLSKIVIQKIDVQQKYKKLSYEISENISKVKEKDFNSFLKQAIDKYIEIECMYIIDKKGVQISDSVCKSMSENQAGHFLFRPAKKGADHSLKKYFYHMNIMKLKEFYTSPYISLATGSLCTTISKSFINDENNFYILCIDFSIN